MPTQSLLGRQPTCLCFAVVVIHRSELTDDVQTRLTKDVYEVNEFTPPVGEAVSNNGLEVSRHIATERIAHLNWRFELWIAMRQELLEVVSSMPPSGLVKDNRVTIDFRNHSTGESTSPRLRSGWLYRQRMRLA